jgi:NAD(P)-dependent dehydrogenase (short-subunit alcohol dehydrogenase family)
VIHLPDPAASLKPQPGDLPPEPEDRRRLMKFKGKVAIITGAGQGLGAAYAKDFASEGASVVLADVNEQTVQTVAAEIKKAGGTALPVVCDVRNEDAVNAMVAKCVEAYGTVDILINNAAIHRGHQIIDTPKAEWDLQIEVNLTGTFLCSKAVLPIMMKKRYGKIVNIASAGAKIYFPGFGAYAASKGGIISLNKALHEEAKEYDINVNTLYLGMINTEYTRERIGKDPAVTIKLEDMMQVDEVSRVVKFFASDDASPIMGADIEVYGKKA